MSLVTNVKGRGSLPRLFASLITIDPVWGLSPIPNLPGDIARTLREPPGLRDADLLK
jgi:hypothetical protein